MATEAPSLSECLSLLSTGLTFYGYNTVYHHYTSFNRLKVVFGGVAIEKWTNRQVRQRVFVFYASRPTPALYWCEPDRREANPERSMILTLISDVFLGKQTPIMQSPIAEKADPNLCFSLRATNGAQLDLEAPSVSILSQFLHSVNTVLTEGPPSSTPSGSISAPAGGAGAASTSFASGVSTSTTLTPRSAAVSAGTALLSPTSAASLRASPQSDKVGGSTAQPSTSTPRSSTTRPSSSTPRSSATASTPAAAPLPASPPVAASYSYSSSNTPSPSHPGRQPSRSLEAPVPSVMDDLIAPELSPRDTIRMMTTGRHFRGFFLTNGTPSFKQIFVFYKYNNQTPDSLGCFYWCDELRKDEIPSQCIPIMEITDVFLGKQTPELKAPLAASVDESRCWSLVSKNHGIHMEADSVTGSGKKVVQQQAAAGSQGRRFSLLPGESKRSGPRPSDSAVSIEAPAVPAGRAVTVEDRLGDEFPFTEYFVDHRGWQGKRRVNVFWANKLTPHGTLYMCEPSLRSSVDLDKPAPKAHVPMSAIQEIFPGKHSPIFQSAFCERLSPANCITLVGKEFEINLEASNVEALKIWLQYVEKLLRGQGKDLVDEPYSSLPPLSNTAAPTLGSGPTVSSSSLIASPLRLSTSSSGDALSSIPRSPAADKDGRGTGSGIGTIAELSPPRLLPLTSSPSSSTPAARGIGLIPAPLVSSPSKDTSVPVDFDPSLMAAFGLKRKTRETGGAQHVVEERLLRLMKSGMSTWMYENSENPSRRPAFVWLDAHSGGALGSLCWCEEYEEKPLLSSSDPQIQAGRSVHRMIALNDIRDIYIGMMAAVFETGLGHLAHEDRAFSLLSNEEALNLEAPSAELRQQWILGIYQILGTAHKHIKLVDEEVVPEMTVANTGRPLLKQWCTVLDPAIPVEAPDFDIRSPRVTADGIGQSSAPPSADESSALDRDIPPEQAAQILQHGIEFHRYSMNPAENNTTVTLFYSDNDGALYWCGKGERKKLAHQTMRVSSITDLYLGHQRQIFHTNRVNDKNCCFSIVSQSENKNLDLECASRIELKLVLAAINYILTAGGKPIQVASTAGVAAKDLVREHLDTIAKGGELATRQAIATLVQGFDLTIFDEGSGIPFSREVHLFYRRAYDASSRDAPGKLFWCDPGLREELPAHSLSLEVITDVFIGKQTHLLKSPVAVEAEVSQCFTLSGAGSIQFNFEANSEDDRRVFLSSLSHLLSTFGADIDDSRRHTSSPSTPSPTQPRYVAGRYIGPTVNDAGQEVKTERKGPQTGVRVHVNIDTQPSSGAPLEHGKDLIVTLSLRSLAPNLAGTCDPVIAMHDNQSGHLLGQTERISKSTSPDFKKTLVVPANLVWPGSFINFNVYDVPMTTSSVVTRLGYVVLPIDALLKASTPMPFELKDEGNPSNAARLRLAKSVLLLKCTQAGVAPSISSSTASPSSSSSSSSSTSSAPSARDTAIASTIADSIVRGGRFVIRQRE